MATPPYTSAFSTPSLFKNLKNWLTETLPGAQLGIRAWDGGARATSRPPTPALPCQQHAWLGGLFYLRFFKLVFFPPSFLNAGMVLTLA